MENGNRKIVDSEIIIDGEVRTIRVISENDILKEIIIPDKIKRSCSFTVEHYGGINVVKAFFALLLIMGVSTMAVKAFGLEKYIPRYFDKLVEENMSQKENDFASDRDVYCEEHIISLKNGWNYLPKERIFTKEQFYVNLKDCSSKEINDK